MANNCNQLGLENWYYLVRSKCSSVNPLLQDLSV